MYFRRGLFYLIERTGLVESGLIEATQLWKNYLVRTAYEAKRDNFRSTWRPSARSAGRRPAVLSGRRDARRGSSPGETPANPAVGSRRLFSVRLRKMRTCFGRRYHNARRRVSYPKSFEFDAGIVDQCVPQSVSKITVSRYFCLSALRSMRAFERQIEAGHLSPGS